MMKGNHKFCEMFPVDCV